MPGTRRRVPRLDYAVCWQRAVAKIRAAADLDVVKEMRAERDPVARARRGHEVAAPAVTRAILALVLGAEPHELERDRSAARLVAEAGRHILSSVGIRSGEVQEHELSDRLQEALTRFLAPAALARRAQVLEQPERGAQPNAPRTPALPARGE